MSFQLSLFDKSPIPEGGTADEALATSVAFAQRAEQLGYHRILLGEHHGIASLAGSAPEVLATWLLAATRSIRIGTGGVLLQHYSPYKVAEVFGVLASLAPGRVDLGIGKAPGGMPYGTRALQVDFGGERQGFEAKLRDLDAFLDGALPDGHVLAGATAVPRAGVAPERILLGASPDSAALAGRLGWSFVYAGHHNGDPGAVERSFAAFRAETGRVPAMAVTVLVSRSAEEAAAATARLRSFRVSVSGGQVVNLTSEDGVAEYLRQAGATDYTVEERRPSVLAGTAEHVRTELAGLSERFGVAEFVLDLPQTGRAERLASLDLLAPVPLREAA